MTSQPKERIVEHKNTARLSLLSGVDFFVSVVNQCVVCDVMDPVVVLRPNTAGHIRDSHVSKKSLDLVPVLRTV